MWKFDDQLSTNQQCSANLILCQYDTRLNVGYFPWGDLMKHSFWLGALGYPALELLYRGRTHYSMALAGGLATTLANRIRQFPLNRFHKAVLCGAAITGIEGLCGCIWNKQYLVWDYRKMPANWHGQICLPYTAIWCGLSAAAMEIMNIAEQHRAGR